MSRDRLARVERASERAEKAINSAEKRNEKDEKRSAATKRICEFHANVDDGVVSPYVRLFDIVTAVGIIALPSRGARLFLSVSRARRESAERCASVRAASASIYVPTERRTLAKALQK